MDNRPDLRRILIPGAVAGIAGGLLMGAYLSLTAGLPQYPNAVALLQFVASAAVGKSALGSTDYAWLGLVMHLCVSAGWGIGYAYLAQTRPAIAGGRVDIGALFGLVVFVVMQVVLASANSLPPPAVRPIFHEILAHIMFGGAVAAVLRTLLRRTAA